MTSPRAVAAVLTVFLFCLPATSYAQDATERTARALVDEGKPREALALLAPLELSRAGDVPFDYVLALATLDAGDAPTATLIFERILLQAPDFHGARVDLGRALFAMGRLQDARTQLTRARAAAPPPAAAAVIDRTLERIDRRQRRARFSHFLSATTRAGYDSNVNSATDVNDFLGFSLNPRSRAQDSDFFEVGFVGGGAYALKPRLALSGRLVARVRRNSRASFADSEVIAATARLDHATASQRRRLEMQTLTQLVDGKRNLSGLSVSGDWRFQLRQGLWLGPLLQLRAVRYQDELEIKDINQWVLGAAGSLDVGGRGQGRIDASVGIGRDRPQQDRSRYDREFTQFTIGLNWQFSDRLSGTLGAAVEDSDFRAVFFESVFDSPRQDTLYQGRAALDWRFARRWRLNPALTYRQNDTDIDVFAFDRFEATLGVHYVWY